MKRYESKFDESYEHNIKNDVSSKIGVNGDFSWNFCPWDIRRIDIGRLQTRIDDNPNIYPKVVEVLNDLYEIRLKIKKTFKLRDGDSLIFSDLFDPYDDMGKKNRKKLSNILKTSKFIDCLKRLQQITTDSHVIDFN